MKLPLKKVPSSSSNRYRKVHYDAALRQLSLSSWSTIIPTIWTTTHYWCQWQNHHRKNVTLNLTSSRSRIRKAVCAFSVIPRASSVSARTNFSAPSVSHYLPSSSTATMMSMRRIPVRMGVCQTNDVTASLSPENNARAEQINSGLMLHYPTRTIAKSPIRAGNRSTTSL